MSNARHFNQGQQQPGPLIFPLSILAFMRFLYVYETRVRTFNVRGCGASHLTRVDKSCAAFLSVRRIIWLATGYSNFSLLFGFVSTQGLFKRRETRTAENCWQSRLQITSRHD